jgi:hypothetical protein
MTLNRCRDEPRACTSKVHSCVLQDRFVISESIPNVLIIWAGDQIMSDMEGQRRQLVTAADLVCTYTSHSHLPCRKNEIS